MSDTLESADATPLNLGTHPVNRRPLRPGWIVFTAFTLAFASWFAYVTLMLLVPYEPTCGIGRRMQYLAGPLRPEFADQLVIVLTREGFRSVALAMWC